MKKKGKKIIFFVTVAISLLIISSSTAVPNIQNTLIKNILNNEVDKNNFWIDINKVINKFNLNDDQIKTFDSLLNQSNFPLEIYFANATAFYHYLPENNSLQILIEGDAREIINSCCSWITIEDIIIIALNQDENSPEWAQHYDADMPCFNLDFNSSPVDIPLNILCDFNATLLKTFLDLQNVEPLLLVQIEEENINKITSNTLFSTPIKIVSLLRACYFTIFAEFFIYVIFFIATLHLTTPLTMAELFYSCVVINTNTNPAMNIVFSQYGHVFILEFIVFIAESAMIYWLCKTLSLRITLPGAITLSLIANVFSFITASSPYKT